MGKCKVLVLCKILIVNFLFDGIIQTILVTFSMKISEASTDMLTIFSKFQICKKTQTAGAGASHAQ